MNGAPPSEWRCRQDDARFARRWTVRTAGQACGRINVVAFRHGVTVADMLHEMPEHASPNDGAAS
jgi:hypothetical protein